MVKQAIDKMGIVAREWMRLALGAAPLVLSLASLAALANPPRIIDRDRTLIGAEMTFQDQAMVNEPGRTTTETPHKREKFESMILAFREIIQAPPNTEITPVGKPHFKPGRKLDVPGVDSYLVDMEPVCVEWNQNPKRVHEMAAAWRPVYQAAERVGLKPYVNPAAERSGMGHMHFGGETVAENPFFRHPTLLRNVMVYMHKHPSLLWGFAEAYDIGRGSNIETFHGERQSGFQNAVAEFDRWYESASEKERINGGFHFLELLWEHLEESGFAHYRFIGLKNVEKLAGQVMETAGHLRGQYTIEFRNLRPPSSPEHAQATGELLLAIMDALARPDMLIPFHRVSDAEYLRFHSVSVVADDWRRVKSELSLDTNPIWEGMIGEYVKNLKSKALPHQALVGVTILPAYSEKEKKGSLFELAAPARGAFAEKPPGLSIGGRAIEWTQTLIHHEPFWVAVVDLSAHKKSATDLMVGRIFDRTPALPLTCEGAFLSF